MYKLQAMKGKACAVALAVALATMGLVGTAFAADPGTEVLVTAGTPQINVTVAPTAVASVDIAGDLTFPTPDYAKMVNNSGFAVEVDTLEVKEAPGFTLVPALTTPTPVAGEISVQVNANGQGSISLDDYTAAAAPGSAWVMDSGNNNIIKMGFSGKALYSDFSGTLTNNTQEKVFDMIWTFKVA